jgi:hypothetical protein
MGSEEYFTEDNLVISCLDLFTAGYKSTFSIQTYAHHF